jgi:hypothetical protein
MLINSSVFPAVSSTNLEISCLKLRSLIQFELIIVQGEKYGSSFQFSLCSYPIFPGIFVEEAVFSPLYVFGTFVKDQVGVAIWIPNLVFYSISLVFISILCQYHAVFIVVTL